MPKTRTKEEKLQLEDWIKIRYELQAGVSVPDLALKYQTSQPLIRYHIRTKWTGINAKIKRQKLIVKEADLHEALLESVGKPDKITKAQVKAKDALAEKVNKIEEKIDKEKPPVIDYFNFYDFQKSYLILMLNAIKINSMALNNLHTDPFNKRDAAIRVGLAKLGLTLPALHSMIKDIPVLHNHLNDTFNQKLQVQIIKNDVVFDSPEQTYLELIKNA